MIFDLVYTLARCRKPVERLWISSLTREAILTGFRHLQSADAYRGLRDAAHCRQQADWLVGLNATQAQTLGAHRAGADGIYSLGRVQTPTLALIVARDQEIAAFVPASILKSSPRSRSPRARTTAAGATRRGAVSRPRRRRTPSPPRCGAGGHRRAGRDACAPGAPAVAL